MTNRVVLAVVGATKFDGDETATDVARTFINDFYIKADKRIDCVISGGAIGIDTLAIELAKEHGFSWQELLPANKRWEPNGYRQRNILIANACTHLLCIQHFKSRTNGSGWTAELARSLSKVVCRMMWNGEKLVVNRERRT